VAGGSRTFDDRERTNRAPLVLGLSLVLVVTGVAAATTSASSGLNVTVEEWCPPQVGGCLPPEDPCATLAEADRWMATHVRVTDTDGEPVRFAEVTLTYTERLDGDEIEREKTEWTDEEGRASFSLRNAVDATVQARADGREAHLQPSPTWGSIHVEAPDDAQTSTLTRGHPVTVSYEVRGLGPTATPNGSLAITDRPGAVSDRLTAEDGEARGTIDGRHPGLTTYEIRTGSICGLPIAGDTLYEVDWREPAIVLSDIPTLEVDGPPLALDAHGVDHEGDRFPIDPAADLSWDVVPSDAAHVRGSQLVPGTNATEATLVTEFVAAPGANASVPIEVEPAEATDLALDCPTKARGGTVVTCTAEGRDPYGNAADLGVADWSAEHQRDGRNAFFKTTNATEARYLTPEQGGPVTIEATTGDARANATIDATDEAPPTIVNITTDVEAEDPLTVDLADPSGIVAANLSYKGRTLDSATKDRPPNTTLRLASPLSGGGDFVVDLRALDGEGHEVSTSLLVDVDKPSGTTDVPDGSASSSPSSSSQADDGGDGKDAPTPAETVTTSATDDGEGKAEVAVTDGRTPTVKTPSADLRTSLHTATHDRLIVHHRPDVAVPDGPPSRPVSTFDVSVETPRGHEAVIDEATITKTIPASEIPADARPAALSLLHWTGTDWQELVTHVREVDEGFDVRASVTSLSPFALVHHRPSPNDPAILTPRDGSDELPNTYDGTITAEAGTEVVAQSADGVYTVRFTPSRSGDHDVALTVSENPSSRLPSSVTEKGRYLDLVITDAQNRRVDPSTVDAEITVEGASLGSDAARLVPVTVERGEWAVAEGSLHGGDGNVTASFSTSSGLLRGIVADGQPPRVGLEDPIPEPLEGEHRVTVVANDNLGVDQVRIVVDGTVLGTAEGPPFHVLIDAGDLGDGDREIVLEAVDAAGNIGKSTRTVTVAGEALDPSSSDRPPASSPEEPSTGDEVPAIGLAGVGLATLSAVLVARRTR